MTFRVGDIVRYKGLGRARWRVKKVNGNKLGVKPLSMIEGREGQEVGPLQTLAERNFELVHTDWKEKGVWALIYKNNRNQEVHIIVQNTEEDANRMRQIIVNDERNYTLLSSTKVTIPYKEPV